MLYPLDPLKWHQSLPYPPALHVILFYDLDRNRALSEVSTWHIVTALNLQVRDPT